MEMETRRREIARNKRKRERQLRLRLAGGAALFAAGLAAFVGVWRWNGGESSVETGQTVNEASVGSGEVVSGGAGQTGVLVEAGAEIHTGLEGTDGRKDGMDSVSGSESRAGETDGVLPEKFDLRERNGLVTVPDQGSFGTCWAFAALKAVETSIPAGLENVGALSADHMSLKNSLGLGLDDGGNSSVASAYLLAWQGPVTESSDPYGDGVSPDHLEAVYHVQEMQILKERDFEAIKKMVYTVGGVQSAFYIPQSERNNLGLYYNEETYGFYYDGRHEANHEIVIVGWDDTYSKENFVHPPKQDGAFLCMNTWGDSFGNDGYFYVSYEDVWIGENCAVYTGVESAENYDGMYQTDFCGWTGQLGYGNAKAWFSNVYEAEGNVEVAAAGFYATVPDTKYRIYATGLEGLESRRELSEVAEAGNEADAEWMEALGKRLSEGVLVAEGTVGNAGYYTVPFGEASFAIADGEAFAVIVEIDSPGAEEPVAIEYWADNRTAKVDIDDGEGYISSDGMNWERTETAYQCNVCLKVYVNGG